MEKHVLYLSYDGLTDPLGQSQILPYLIGLSKSGYRFHIISFEKRKAFQPNASIVQDLIKEENIQWYPIRYHKQPPILSSLFDIWLLNRKAKTLVKHYSIDLVHCRSYISSLVGLRLKRQLGTKFLFDMRGFWADERVDGGIWNLKNPIFKWVYTYFKKKESEMIHIADHIISLTNSGKDEMTSGRLMRSSHGIDPNKISVIPCAVDLDLFDRTRIDMRDQENLKKKLGLENAKHVLVYLGSIGTWYLLDEMLLYFKEIEANKEDSYFLLVSGDDPSYIMARAKLLGVNLNQMVIKGAQRKEVPTYLSIATLGIFFIKPVYSKKASSATKMGEMFAMGLPIVTNLEVGDVNLIKDKFNANHSMELLPSSIKSLKIVKIDNTYSRSMVRDYFSLEKGLMTYLNVYNQS